MIDKILECHPDLQKVYGRAKKENPSFDFICICGSRGEAEQNKAFSQGKSKLKFPNSKHNKILSEAMDLVPLPVNWNDIARFKKLGAIILEAAKKKMFRSVGEEILTETILILNQNQLGQSIHHDFSSIM